MSWWPLHRIVVTPAALADTAADLARDYGLELKVLERTDCEARGMGAFLAVSQGSDLDPKFLHLIYRPTGEVKRLLALVGKGLTFDSGGYNLKVGAAQIDMMKFDMGGSAAVLGAMRSIGELKPEGGGGAHDRGLLRKHGERLCRASR